MLPVNWIERQAELIYIIAKTVTTIHEPIIKSHNTKLNSKGAEAVELK